MGWVLISIVRIWRNYGQTIGWEISAGRDFSRSFAADSAAVILNESAVRFMGLKQPIGETIQWFGQPYTVIGVSKDMIIESPYDPIRPLVSVLSPTAGGSVTLKLHPGISTHTALEKIETVFKKFNPEQPFSYSFIDEEFAKKFLTEERVARLAAFFAALAIFISCLGLFGMASFTAEQRIKEIGVRKVLGASVFSLWKMLSKDFVTLVLISLMIAIPLGYYFMNNWLSNYEYRYTIAPWIFIVAGFGAILITLATVTYQSIKAAIVNPVRSLRSN